VAGIAIGPSALGLVGHDSTLRVLGEIGVLLLLLEVGLEMDRSEMTAVGRSSLVVGIIGVAAPMGGGIVVANALGHGGNTALFLGAALAATSVGITARVLSDLRALATSEARTVLGAAVADDVLGLVILTVVVRIVSEGSVSVLTVAGIAGVAIGFLVIAAVVGSLVGPRLFERVQQHARSSGTPVALALAFTLTFATLADAARLAPIVGAFVAGIALSGSKPSERIRRELTPVGHLFIPVFFLQIGIEADVSAFAEPEVLGLGGALLVVAVIGKLLSSLGASRATGDRWLIGLGMMPRGEVGLIFAAIGLQEGVLSDDLYAALLVVVLATTLAAPPLLRWRIGALRRRPREQAVAVPPPSEGWLREVDGIIQLTATPPEHLALHVALEAAPAMADARPGSELLHWLGSMADAQIRWDASATKEFLAVLRAGNARSWRFLETTGVLERALPELAAVIERRRADPFVVDPAHVLRFELVAAVLELVNTEHADELAALEHPEWLLLAALILDCAGEDASPVPLARRLVQRLELGAAAEEEVALLVGDSALLRAAASRVDGLAQENILQLATHLGRPERTRALFLLSIALGELDPWERDRLDVLLTQVLAVLDDFELTGLDARNLVERRRAEAVRLVGDASRTATRIEHAPRGYVLTQHAGAIARHAALLEPLPPRGQARVAVLPETPYEWRVDVACRDAAGLLATVSGVLAGQNLDVVEAVVATWADGGALESFGVRAPHRPDHALLEQALAAALGQPLASHPDPDAEVRFDDDSSPWYSRCEVRSRDRPGLLHAITVGIGAAGADVHAARVMTENGQAVDRFELTDREGHKLDDAAKEAIRRALANGVVPRRTRRRNRVVTGSRQEGEAGRSSTRSDEETLRP
jgi:Kef-type K+ transport system membrane component KefB